MLRLCIALITCWALTGCSQKLASYDFDPKQDYQSLTKYFIKKSERNSYQSLDDARIEAAIKKVLAGRYELVDESSADFQISYLLEADRKVDQSGFSFGFGVASSNIAIGANTAPEAEVKTEGRLVLDVISTATEQVIWSAKARKNLRDSMKPEQRQALIEQLVTEMLGSFPP